MYDQAPPEPARAGASAGDGGAPLPQSLWLRGDEAYCADFNLDADAVMSQLGIRRSRLTQISGKELRVARIRRGRYVSPVYRQADVDAYLALTRATASHLRSSAVLTDAAETLRRQGEELGDRLTTVPQTLAARFETSLARTEQALASAQFDHADALSRQLGRLTGDVRQAEAAAGAARAGVGALGGQLAGVGAAVAAQSLLLERLLLDIRELGASLRNGLGATGAGLASLTAAQAELAAQVAEEVAAAQRRPATRKRRCMSRATRRRLARQAAVAPQATIAKVTPHRRPPRAGR